MKGKKEVGWVIATREKTRKSKEKRVYLRMREFDGMHRPTTVDEHFANVFEGSVSLPAH